MLIKRKKPWEIPESEAAPEEAYLDRRKFLKDAGVYSIGAGLLFSGFGAKALDLFGKDRSIIEVPKTPTSNLYPAPKNPKFTLDRPLTDELIAARYNNFYEFSSGKGVWRHVDRMKVRPWTVEVAGLVEKPWSTLAPDEYDFLANVNPEVPHPRWSQATEKMIGTDEIRPTMKYNGYGEYVAGIYS